MKKLLLFGIILSLSLSFFSCEDDDGSEPRTYQVFNNCTKKTYNDPYLDGSMYEVKVHFYKDGNKEIGIQEYGTMAPGTITDTIDAPTGAKQAKVSFKLLPKASVNYNSDKNKLFYTYYTALVKGEHTVILIEDETNVTPSSVNPNKDLIEWENILLKEQRLIIK
ncbi:hypothetical protein LJB95_00295 [Paludibacteraceae bacterium OttesenSCG-928-F17]|nr:hypothetical protein [Paludibacteraceae bacterium OttesenSCG-928-F17]